VVEVGGVGGHGVPGGVGEVPVDRPDGDVALGSGHRDEEILDGVAVLALGRRVERAQLERLLRQRTGVRSGRVGVVAAVVGSARFGCGRRGGRVIVVGPFVEGAHRRVVDSGFGGRGEAGREGCEQCGGAEDGDDARAETTLQWGVLSVVGSARR
jgi:hypothetical protein